MVFLTVLSAAAYADQVFLQAEGEPLEVVTNVKQVPIVGSQFRTDQGVTTAMQCVISLTIQFMIVYTALALCRMAADGYGLKYDNVPIQKILQTATLTVAFALILEKNSFILLVFRSLFTFTKCVSRLALSFFTI